MNFLASIFAMSFLQLASLPPGESCKISMIPQESEEWQIVQEVLGECPFPTIAEYQAKIENKGLTITHKEVARSLKVYHSLEELLGEGRSWIARLPEKQFPSDFPEKFAEAAYARFYNPEIGVVFLPSKTLLFIVQKSERE